MWFPLHTKYTCFQEQPFHSLLFSTHRPVTTSTAWHNLLGDTQRGWLSISMLRLPLPLVPLSDVWIHCCSALSERGEGANRGPGEQMKNAPEIKLWERIQKMKRENERDRRRGEGGVMVIYGRHATQISIRSVITNRWSLAVTIRWSLGWLSCDHSSRLLLPARQL